MNDTVEKSMAIGSGIYNTNVKFTPEELQELKVIHETNGDMDEDLWLKVYEYFLPGMPYGTAKARSGDPYEYCGDRLGDLLKDHGVEV